MSKCKECGQVLPVADQLDMCSPLPGTVNQNEKKPISAMELAEAWKNFKPTVPLSYVVASLQAAKWWRR